MKIGPLQSWSPHKFKCVFFKGEDSSDEEGGEVSKTDVVEEEEFDKWGELDHDADKIGEDEITKRLAVCNMDWDRVSLILNSFFSPFN